MSSGIMSSLKGVRNARLLIDCIRGTNKDLSNADYVTFS